MPNSLDAILLSEILQEPIQCPDVTVAFNKNKFNVLMLQ